MRVLVTAVVVVVALVVGVAALALLNLRALIGAHHDRLVARVASMVGRPIEVGAIVPSWWPLGVRLHDVTIGEDAAFGTEPFLRAEGVVMGVRPWPLIHGRIEAAGVTLDRPRLNLVRDRSARWNVESLGLAADDGGNGKSKSKESRFAVRVPLEWVVGLALTEMRDGDVTIEDRRADPPMHVVLRHVRLHAEDVRFGATARVRVDAALFAADAPDTRLDLQVAALGQNDVEHAPFTARFETADADLGQLGGWLGKARVGSGRVRRLTIDADGTLERARAKVEVDAVDPALRVGTVPVGRMQPLGVRATLASTREAVTIEDLRATSGTLTATAHGEATLEPAKVSLVVASDPGGVATLALDHTTVTVRALAGHVTFEREGAHVAPLEVQVDDVPLTVNGWITSLDPPALDLRLDARPFGGTLGADLAVDAGGAARARIEAAAIDLAPAVTRFAPELGRTIAGTASGAAVLAGRVVNGTLATGSLTGNGSVSVVGGRLRDVNVPDLVVDQIERIPLMPTLVSASTRARYGELFASKDTILESASVPFSVAHGRLATEHALLVNPAYQVTGDGWIDEARALRFHGTVLLGASISRTLREDVHAAKYLAADDGRIELPFVARGRLGDVRVEPDGKRLRARGLEALLGDGVDGVPPNRGRKRESRQRDEELEHEVIERLEKMLKP